MTDASNGPSEREKALAERVAELEALVKNRREGQKGGNIVEQIWRYFAMFVPPPIIAAGVAVFVLFQAWDFYNEPQLTTAENHLKSAQASVDDVKALASATLVNGEPLRTATIKAQVQQKKAEALTAKAQADALTATIDGEEAALQKVKADVAKQQAAAAKAKQDAETATARFGLQTLTEREAFVQFVKSEVDKMEARHDAAAQKVNAEDSSLMPGYAERTYPVVIDAMCTDNALAKYVGCPDQYIRRAPPASIATAVPAAIQGQPPESEQPSGLRTPKKFNCDNASLGTDYVVCASPKLMDAMARLEDVYAAARAGTNGTRVKSEEWDWIKRYGPACGLPPKGRPSDTLIQGTSYCVGRAIEGRIKELEAER